MVAVGICFNPMNVLVYKINDLYISLTLIYGGLLMASNMIWAHEIIHYLSIGHFNMYTFLTGVSLSLIISFVMRKQIFVNDKQWLKRMISHHSTALTTSHRIHEKTKNTKLKQLAKSIIETQEKEIILMKQIIKDIS
jgi:regulator of sigma D